MLVLVALAPSIAVHLACCLDLVLTLALTEGDCSPNTFPILWRVPRLLSSL